MVKLVFNPGSDNYKLERLLTLTCSNLSKLTNQLCR